MVRIQPHSLLAVVTIAILGVAILGVLAEADSCVTIESYSRVKPSWFKTF
ncbi:MAG TPA: hypothetical protein IGR64_09825 [Leptolyngbyaceae cyanobacterium M65_K2018_010]|nr:hypothetical protein [Leptolyngbyaceae cyanobacterium M65_K2018_010]